MFPDVPSVRFGVIGAGAMARAYAQALTTEVPDGELVAFAGSSRAPAAAADYGVESEPSIEALLARDDLDAIVVATPPAVHAEQTIAAARSGRHVLVEKPMAPTIADCDRMIDACRDAGVLLAVNKVSRYRDAALGAKRAVDDGAIGDVRMLRIDMTRVNAEDHMPGKALGSSMSWIRDPAQGSSFLDFASHGCDVLRWLSGSEPVLAFGAVGDFAPDPVPPLGRSAMAQYRFESGAIAQLWCTTELPAPGTGHNTMALVAGSEGMLEIDTYGAARLGRGDDWETIAQQAPIDYMNRPWDPERIRGWARQTQELCVCIRRGGRPGVTGEDGRAAVEMVVAAERSSATGQAVRLPLH